MERESFLFYVSWLDGVKRLPIKTQKEIKVALLDYCAYGIEPNLDKVSPEVYLAFTFAKPQIDANNRRYENGFKGGAPKGSRNNPNGRRGNKPMVSLETNLRTNSELTKNKPMVSLRTNSITNQELTKNKPNDNDNDNVNVNDNVNENENDIINNIDKCAGNFQEKLSDTAQIILENEKPKRVYFKKPTLEEVKEYVNKNKEKYPLVDPEDFYLYYEKVGWKVGKKDMKNWKMAVAHWQRMEKTRQHPNSRVGVVLQDDESRWKGEKQGW